jgi:galactofuranose transport system permease protein
MMQNLNLSFSKYRRFLPVSATILLFCIAYTVGAVSNPGMRDGQVFFTLFITTPFLLINAIGETFVIISGGIDLSVSGMIALTSTASAALLLAGWNPWAVMLLMLAMGMALGAIMGGLITYLKVQPFIATLAGMWFTRGMCYIISDNEIRIRDPLYKLLAGTKILIPGLSDVVSKKGDFITILVVLSMTVFMAAIYIAHFTKFGRTVYAIGGNNGANEQSARLMGLPVDRAKILVYTFNGFCSALAGIAYSIYVGSGHGTHASNGYEMTVIASVVIGGTMLAGGQGYVFGSLFGVLITALIQTLIQFNGKLSSWWTSIAIGLLTLVFIGVQSLLVNLNARQLSSRRTFGQSKVSPEASAAAGRKRRSQVLGGISAVVIILAAVTFFSLRTATNTNSVNGPTKESASCQLKPFRENEAQGLIKDGAVIVYERNGGIDCVDELYAIYPDGRIVGDNGTQQITRQVTSAEVDQLLLDINNLGWFTDDMYSTKHRPCGACFTYFTTVSYQGQEKTVQAVDGGTDAPANYWQMSGEVTVIVPKFDSAP